MMKIYPQVHLQFRKMWSSLVTKWRKVNSLRILGNTFFLNVVILASFLFVLAGLNSTVTGDTSSSFIKIELAECADSLDNDGDGLIDFPADPDCSSAIDDNESTPVPDEACADGVDNDGDGLIDHPADPGCSSPTDDNETDPPPGVTIVVGGGGTQALPEDTDKFQDEIRDKVFKLVDFNKDQKVNMKDFSILLYAMSENISNSLYDLNSDGVIDIVDVSIFLFFWA